MAARPDLPPIHYVDGEFVSTRDVPFSPSLDELIADIRSGQAPNLGRFCGYCCTPLGADSQRCATCDTRIDDVPPRSKIPRPLAAVYTRKRKIEARIIHSAAWLGIALGTGIGSGLILALPSWTKIVGVIFLLAGSFYIASYFGNVLAQNYAYRRGFKAFAQRWQEYLRARASGAAEDDA